MPIDDSSSPDRIPQRRHHLDRRALELIEKGTGQPDDLLSTPELARWFGVSDQWVEIARHQGRGPPWVALSPRTVRYRRDAVWAWLDERVRTSTRGYAE